MKNLLRILYIGFAFIIAIFVYMIGYNSNSYTYIQNLTTNAITSKDYVEVAKIHGGCFYAESIASDESDKYDIAIFPSATLSTYKYYTSDSADAEIATDYIYENSYYLYIFYPEYENENLVADKVFNKTGIRFNSDSASYDYYFTVSQTLNTDQYKEMPTNINESALNIERVIASNYSNWGFYNVTLTKTMIDAMALNGTVSSIDILDSYGEVVDTVVVNLDFSQKFFSDVEPLSVEYNTFINDYNSATVAKDDDAADQAEAKFNEFYDGDDDTVGFKKTFFEIDSKNAFRHDDDYLRPGKLVWSTIGMLLLYLVCAALLYLLLFHFNQIKAIVFKDRSGTYRKGYGAYNKSNTIDAKVQPVKEAKPQASKQISETAFKPEEKASPVDESKIEAKEEIDVVATDTTDKE